ncbi:tryptophan 7-halogenase [Novosphingobium sp. KCTC 2891]|uniref:tryptophan halogenase family protein n=1 Tax=Novosphingobium sp. KCTC 2891 TaxID=2989730 RepID=UPI0022218D99|nr:tryptophan halogenase family protein [Novosphingobium sp. KCTC 2891]MCW1383757.1 tryptophan 7-halogenase [Novosphingobium sp. KCTC 2891]
MTAPMRIAIIGGGTAGWMAANLFARRWADRGVAVTLVEAPGIATIGVGEGSTPSLKRFFEVLGIAERDWMPACDATYKASIRFRGWSPESCAAEYSHPFLTQIDVHTEDAFVNNCRNRRLGYDVPTRPDDFLLNGVLAAQGKAPVAPAHFPFSMEYGYHFDSALLGAFLRNHAVGQGVTHLPRRIVDVQRAEDGCIAAVQTDRGERVEADLFVDCTGFAALLMRQALDVPFHSFKSNLFNDAAVVLPTPAQAVLPVETTATALSAGWAWAIPLTSRTGNGYVYSSDFLSADQAEAELRAMLGVAESAMDARHLRFNVGQLARHWDCNCLAVGLAQGFIEPLEATALHLVLNTVDLFMDHLEQGDFTPRHRDAFNATITDRIERVRDYIVAHYKLNTRTDSAYWQANRDNEDLSEPLLHILETWFRRGDLASELDRQGNLSHFRSASWHCLLAGYGTFPPLSPEQRGDVDFHRDRDIARFLGGCSLNFPEHAAALAGAPDKPSSHKAFA